MEQIITQNSWPLNYSYSLLLKRVAKLFKSLGIHRLSSTGLMEYIDAKSHVFSLCMRMCIESKVYLTIYLFLTSTGKGINWQTDFPRKPRS
jgi:hypothetical protein